MNPPKIISTATTVPRTIFTQNQILALRGFKNSHFEKFFKSSLIQKRRLALPRNFSFNETPIQAQERAWGLINELGCQAAQSCLKRAGINHLSLIATNTTTSNYCPGLDVSLIEKLDLPRNIERLGLTDIGSAGGVLALKRAADFLSNHPGSSALLVAAEACSACYSPHPKISDAVAEALFADGAAAAVISNKKSLTPGFTILQTHSLTAPEYASLMSFSTDTGRRIFNLSKDVRERIVDLLEKFFKGFLSKTGLKRQNISHWIMHPAGAKILESAQKRLDLSPRDIRWTWDIYKSYGNLASATVFFVLDRVIKNSRPQNGDYAVLVAMGPGLGIEGALLQWQQ